MRGQDSRMTSRPSWTGSQVMTWKRPMPGTWVSLGWNRARSGDRTRAFVVSEWRPAAGAPAPSGSAVREAGEPVGPDQAVPPFHRRRLRGGQPDPRPATPRWSAPSQRSTGRQAAGAADLFAPYV